VEGVVVEDVVEEEDISVRMKVIPIEWQIFLLLEIYTSVECRR